MTEIEELRELLGDSAVTLRGAGVQLEKAQATIDEQADALQGTALTVHINCILRREYKAMVVLVEGAAEELELAGDDENAELLRLGAARSLARMTDEFTPNPFRLN